MPRPKKLYEGEYDPIVLAGKIREAYMNGYRLILMYIDGGRVLLKAVKRGVRHERRGEG
ncbi:MAG: hypothetical protein QXT64_01525 [Desulfurococcaceae archaeon]